jgi:hypothetical protein
VVRPADAQQQAPASPVTLGQELERRAEEAERWLERMEGDGAVAGVGERVVRGVREVVCAPAGRAGQLERLQVVVSQHLRVVLSAPEPLDPARGGEVLAGALGARDLAVGDVPDEEVPERVLVLAGDAARALAADELLPLELV